MNPKDPTPSEIAAACLEIQGGWSAEERLKRLRFDLRPTFRTCDGLPELMTAAAYDRHHKNREAIT